MKSLFTYYFVTVFLATIFCVPQPAHAYIDPGTGSLILQCLAAAAITGLAFIRSLREKIRSLFKFKKEKK